MGSRKAARPLHYDLEVWQHAMRLAREVYRASVDFPETEKFGLSSQIRRSVVSVAANIAEGAGRGSRADYARFLRIARGSLMELDTHIWLAHDLGFLRERRDLHESVQHLAAMLSALIKSKASPKP